MQFETWLIFLVTSIGLSLSPGPNGLLALTHGAMYGYRKTSFTILGGAAGFIVVIALCMFGIGALIKSSVVWFTLLKWLGGLYLVWLGIQVWRSPPVTSVTNLTFIDTKGGTLFRQGLFAATTNPKALLFFSAFLPQFMAPHRSLMPQFAVVALTFVGTEIVAEYALASAANRVRPWLARVGRRFNRVCGGMFVAIGAALPLRA